MQGSGGSTSGGTGAKGQSCGDGEGKAESFSPCLVPAQDPTSFDAGESRELL